MVSWLPLVFVLGLLHLERVCLLVSWSPLLVALGFLLLE